jgi:eukaryotic-like serine/threonine-protein kinase
MERNPQQDDELVMGLVDLALAQPENQRESCLRNACSGNADLFSQAWSYVQWEARMQGFLLEPLLSAENEAPFEPGRLLDSRFRIEREVARGGMGIVYEAFDEKLGRRIALKCARSGFGKRLPPEVRHASEISHPNVCRIFEIHTASTVSGDVDFLTMEFLEGETLGARLGHGPLTEAEARGIGEQICAGLAEAHRNGVVHGDLKSNNVILARDPEGGVRAVITDFGLAYRPLAAVDEIAGGAGSSQAAGTPDYMAPELWKGENQSAASDVYALGVILRELAGGQRTSQDRTHDPILRRCLEADPAKRFQSAVEVAAAMDATRSRRRWTWVTAAAALLATVVGSAVYETASAPKESVRLAMLPLRFGSNQGAGELAERISRDAAEQLGKLTGGKRAKLSITRRQADSVEQARSALGATHVVHGTLNLENGKVVVHAFLTDARNQVNSGDWTAIYAPGEVHYAGMAIAGMVTGALHLPPLPEAVNDAAKKDYWEGLWYAHRNSTVDRALPPLERAVAADPDSPLTWAGLAEAQWFKYFLTKDQTWLDRCNESLLEAQRRNLDLAPVHRVAGLLRGNAGLYEQAESEYLRAIELDPHNGDAYRRLAKVYKRNHQLDQALAMLKKAAVVAPNDFKVYQDLGTYYLDQGNERDAVRQYQNCVQLAADEPDCHRVLGMAYLDLGRYVDAEGEFRIAIALAKTPTADLFLSLAGALMYQGRDREAIPFLELALSQSPSDSLSWINLGTAYRRANRPRESEAAYRRGWEQAEKAVLRNFRDSVERSHLAFLSACLGDQKRAEMEIKQALSSSDTTITRGMAVRTYVMLGNLDQALEILATSPDEVLLDAARWPDLAELQKDSRFRELLASRQIKQ